jgi:hypothetical protein
MNTFLQASYSSREEAEAAVRNLIQRGVRQENLSIAEAAEPAIEAPAPVGPALGSGVTPEATHALVEEHFDDPVSLVSRPTFVVTVDAAKDSTQSMVAREFFGYLG